MSSVAMSIGDREIEIKGEDPSKNKHKITLHKEGSRSTRNKGNIGIDHDPEMRGTGGSIRKHKNKEGKPKIKENRTGGKGIERDLIHLDHLSHNLINRVNHRLLCLK